MASIKEKGSKGHHEFTLEVAETSYSEANNTSTIHYKLTAAASSYDFSYSSKTVDYSINIGGNTYSKSTGSYPKNKAWVVLEGNCTVGHNADGSLNMSYSFSVKDNINASYTTGNCSKNGTVALTTIPRASQPSCITWPQNTQNVGYFGDTITIHMNRKSDDFTHTVRYAWCSKTGTIATNITNNCRWTIPLTFMEDIPSAKSGWGRVIVDTYRGSKKIGTKECRFDVSVNEANSKPELADVSIVDTNPATLLLTGNPQTIIPKYSNIHAHATATAKSYASMHDITATIGNSSISENGATLDKDFAKSYLTTNVANITAKDTRGITNSQEVSLNIINYIPITLSAEIDSLSTEGSTTIRISGDYFNGSFGAEDNGLIIKYKYADDWILVNVNQLEITDNKYTATVPIEGLDYRQSYTFEILAEDMLTEAPTQKITISSVPIFDWGKNDFNFNVPVSFSAGVVSDLLKIVEVETAVGSSLKAEAALFKPPVIPEVEGYKFLTILNGWGNGSVIFCAPNGWIRNPTNSALSVDSITWRLLYIKGV